MVPAPVQVKDYRNEGGVFYEAICDQCGRKFFPKRSTAKYCCKQCGIEARNGRTLIKEDELKLTKTIKESTQARNKLKELVERGKKRKRAS
jgi:uncharacterized OB-fold protein